jgi:flagellar basal-body rod modification protein FlgD
MTIAVNSSTNGTSGTSAASPTSSTGGIDGLTMNDFLTLMTAQLKEQDPLNPTDSNQFLGELSELSTVEGISQLNTNVSSLSNSLLQTQAVNSAGLVGQTVLAATGNAQLSSGGTISGAVAVPANASAVTLTISNSAGQTVAQYAMPTTQGMQSFSWDGATSSGGTAPADTYSVAASAMVSGNSQTANTYLNGTVTSVTLDSTNNSVLLNTSQLGPVALTSVEQIN